jgi:hypothetical protein
MRANRIILKFHITAYLIITNDSELHILYLFIWVGMLGMPLRYLHHESMTDGGSGSVFVSLVGRFRGPVIRHIYVDGAPKA